MSEYVYATIGDPVANALCEIFLPRCEIVRCRDCRHFEFGEVHMFDGRRSDMYMCARMKGCRVATEPDGFCWRGVRRDA